MKRYLRGLMLGFICCILLMASASAQTQGALFEAEIALIQGEALTLFTVWPSTQPAPAWPEDEALLVQVTPPDGEAYRFAFPSYEGNDAAAAVPLLRFQDMNGDGILDVEAVFAIGASNTTSTYYLYDPADGRLHYSAELSILANAEYDAENHVIFSWVSDGAARQYYALYGIEDGTPVLLRTAYMEADFEDDLYVLRVGVEVAATGEQLFELTTLLDEGEEAAMWNSLYLQLMEILYEGENISPDEL